VKQPGRRLLLPSIAAALAFVALCGLGVWQVERLFWKEALIAQANARLETPPVPPPPPAEWAGLDLAAAEYRPVSVTGRYDNGREIHVIYTLTEPRGPSGGLGYVVMTPFTTKDGWIVYVNRGFVPAAKTDPQSRAAGLVEGDAVVSGLLRAPGHRAWFMPSDNAAKNQWLSRDPALYAAAQGLPAEKVAPYIIDAAFDASLPGGLPQGGETIVSFPNNHLGYAITWFGLAAALAGVFAVFVRRRSGATPQA
jgi:surfeit locus 1 family protein